MHYSFEENNEEEDQTKHFGLYLIRKLILWCWGWVTSNYFHTKTKKKSELSEQKHGHPLTPHSVPSGIWQRDWDGQRGICHWEGPSVTTRHPLTGGREHQPASGPLSQSHQQQLRKEDKQFIHSSSSMFQWSNTALCHITFWISAYDASRGVEDIVDRGSPFSVQGCNFWTARARKNVAVHWLQV